MRKSSAQFAFASCGKTDRGSVARRQSAADDARIGGHGHWQPHLPAGPAHYRRPGPSSPISSPLRFVGRPRLPICDAARHRPTLGFAPPSQNGAGDARFWSAPCVMVCSPVQIWGWACLLTLWRPGMMHRVMEKQRLGLGLHCRCTS